VAPAPAAVLTQQLKSDIKNMSLSVVVMSNRALLLARLRPLTAQLATPPAR
jgi:hypothetical protein